MFGSVPIIRGVGLLCLLLAVFNSVSTSRNRTGDMATEDNIIETLVRSTRDDMTSMVGFNLQNPTSTLWFVDHNRPEFGSVDLDSLVEERFKFMHLGVYNTKWNISSPDMRYEAYYSGSSTGGKLAFPVTPLGIVFKLRTLSCVERGGVEVGQVYEVSGDSVICSKDSVCGGLVWKRLSPVEYSLYFSPNPTDLPRYYRIYVYVANNGYYRNEGRIREMVERGVFVGKRWPVAILEFIQYGEEQYSEEALIDIRQKLYTRHLKWPGYDDGYEDISMEEEKSIPSER